MVAVPATSHELALMAEVQPSLCKGRHNKAYPGTVCKDFAPWADGFDTFGDISCHYLVCLLISYYFCNFINRRLTIIYKCN